MSINLKHLRALVVQPVLAAMAKGHNPAMASPAAEELMMGTAYQESRAHHLKQLGSGPALGLWQVEPATGRWLNQTLRRKAYEGLRDYFQSLSPGRPAERIQAMPGNLYIACAYARLRYWVVPEAMPEAGDIRGLAAYWKEHYNTVHGAGTVEEWQRSYRAMLKAKARA